MMICVNCGNKATKGSMKHPYCEKCFKEEFDNDIYRYYDYVEKTHY